MIKKKKIDPSRIIGWREWVSLPGLNIPTIKAKIDTGARTSTLHAIRPVPFMENGRLRVRFKVHPIQERKDIEVLCVADLVDRREIRDSGGHKQERYVIETTLALGEHSWSVEFTLTNRSNMSFRMLIGRKALQQKRLYINSSRSFLIGGNEQVYDGTFYRKDTE